MNYSSLVNEIKTAPKTYLPALLMNCVQACCEAKVFRDVDALIRAVHNVIGDVWTKETPSEQGWYWHWNGDGDCSPVPVSVMWSGTDRKCFVTGGQLGHEHASELDQWPGWWKPLREPPTLNIPELPENL